MKQRRFISFLSLRVPLTTRAAAFSKRCRRSVETFEVGHSVQFDVLSIRSYVQLYVATTLYSYNQFDALRKRLVRKMCRYSSSLSVHQWQLSRQSSITVFPNISPISIGGWMSRRTSESWWIVAVSLPVLWLPIYQSVPGIPTSSAKWSPNFYHT